MVKDFSSQFVASNLKKKKSEMSSAFICQGTLCSAEVTIAFAFKRAWEMNAGKPKKKRGGQIPSFYRFSLKRACAEEKVSKVIS